MTSSYLFDSKFWRRLFPSLHRNYVFRVKLDALTELTTSVPDAYTVIFPADPFAFADNMGDVHLSRVALRERIDLGDLLGVITCEDKVVHRSLMQQRGWAQLEGDRRGFPLQATQAFIHSCETAGDHRSRALYAHMLGCILHWAQRAGYQEALISCAQSNIASIRGILKAGFRFHASTTVLSAGWERLAWVRWSYDPVVFEGHTAQSAV
jgi:hypothetical protein